MLELTGSGWRGAVRCFRLLAFDLHRISVYKLRIRRFLCERETCGHDTSLAARTTEHKPTHARTELHDIYRHHITCTRARTTTSGDGVSGARERRWEAGAQRHSGTARKACARTASKAECN